MTKHFFLFLILFLFVLTSNYAQKEVSPEETLITQDSDFNIKDFPEKWKNQSAIILCQKMIYIFDKKGSKIIDKEIIRKRVKLLDKSAIGEFSEFFFVSTQDISIDIIKPDGTKNKIDLKDAVAVSEEIEIPYFYKSNFRAKREYKKIAIPGLEVNDIIDYYYIAEGKRTLPGFEFAFPEILVSLNNTYPSLKQKIEFQVEKGFNINFKSQNGAPDLKEKESNVEGIKVFYFEDTEREKYNWERWSYLYRTTPSIKFQVVYTKTPQTSDYFLGEMGIPKKQVSEKEILAKVQGIALKKNSFVSAYNKSIDRYIKLYKRENKVKIVPPTEIAKQAYYMYRHYRYYNPTGYSLASALGEDEDLLFTKCLAGTFIYYKMNFKILVAPPVQVTNLEDVVLKEELLWLLRVDDGGKSYYLFPPSLHSSFNEVSENYEGTNAYEININKDPKKSSITKTKIVNINAEDHYITEKLQVSVDSNLNNFKVKRILRASGYQKDYYQPIIYYFETAQSEFNTYQDALYPYYYSFGSTDSKKREEHEEKVKERLKSDVETDYDLVDYKDYSIDFNGRGSIKIDDSLENYQSNFFGLSDEFTIKGLLKKAGPNYLLDAGKLLGTQVEIEQKEMTRKTDIQYHPRSFKTEIYFTIPQGYYLEGIENLTMNVENSTGHFKSTASIEGQVLTIKVSKLYKNNFEKKEDWEKVVEFVNAAYKFTQAKVLLKKSQS